MVTVRVLLVEDDELITQALQLAFADEGFDVLAAASGEQALAALDTTVVDVVLLDLMLPGVDGMSVCRTLRGRGDLPIIIVTARADTTDVIAGLEAGADDYVTKPLFASELAARIRALLRRRMPDRAAAFTVGDIHIRWCCRRCCSRC
jgi:DNA-binding response OmpR family regulator